MPKEPKNNQDKETKKIRKNFDNCLDKFKSKNRRRKQQNKLPKEKLEKSRVKISN